MTSIFCSKCHSSMGEISCEVSQGAVFVCKNCAPKSKSPRKPSPRAGRRELGFSEYAPDASPDDLSVMGVRPEEQLTIYTSRQRKEALDDQICRDVVFHTVRREDIAETAPILESMIPDAEEREVVYAKMRGYTRDIYLAEASNEKDRLRRQAAWKRHQRHGIPSGLRQALERAAQTRLKQPEWEDRRDRDAWYDRVNNNSFGLGGGKRTPSRNVGEDK